MTVRKAAAGLTISLLAFAGLAAERPETGRPRRPVWQVQRLAFAGNEHYSASALRGLGLRCAPAWRKKPDYSRYKLEQDTTLIGQFYRSQGFLKVHIRVDPPVYDSTRRQMRLVVRINEGPRTRVAAVRLTGVSPRNRGKLLKAVALKARAPLALAVLVGDAQTIITWLGDRGYLEAAADYQLRLSADSLTAEVEYMVRPGPHIRVVNTRTSGLRRVSGRVVQHALCFKRYGPLTRPALRATVNNLYATGLFSFVMITFDSLASRNPANDSLRVVRIRVMEAKFFTGELAAGYQTYEQVRGRLNVSYSNFLGQGVKGYASLFANLITQGVEMGGTFPWLFKEPVTLETRLAYRHQDEPRIKLRGYFTDLVSSVSYQASPFLRLSLNHRLENTRLAEDPVLMPDSLVRNQTQSIGAQLNRDSRNDIFNPRKGTYSRLSLEVSGLGGSGGNQFVKFEADGRMYRPAKSWGAAATGWRAGIVMPYGASVMVPLQERFYLGGSSVLRGFDDKTVGPRVDGTPTGGTLYLAVNVAELRFPVYKWLGGSVFVDAGNLWNVESDALADFGRALYRAQLRYNAGCSLRAQFPVFTLNAEVGFKLDRRPGEKPVAFRLNVGNSF